MKIVPGARVLHRRLHVRRLDEDNATLLPGTEGAEGPFFSPDGQWIGFWSPWRVRKVRVSGAGMPEVICEAVDFRGGTWAGSTIVFAPGQDKPLLRVPDTGGKPAIFTKVLDDEGGHRFPQVPPDGDTILFPARPKLFDSHGYRESSRATGCNSSGSTAPARGGRSTRRRPFIVIPRCLRTISSCSP